MLENYIGFEGLPRSGKSTQLGLLSGGKTVYVCQRFESKYLKDFLEIKAERTYDNSDELLGLACEILRHEIVNNHVQERLDAGELVLSDRHKFTWICLFQALGGDFKTVYSLTQDMPAPGRTFYFDISPELSVQRSIKTGQDPLKCDLEFQRKVHESYMKLASEHGFIVVDASQSIDYVAAEVRRVLASDQ